MDIVGGHCGWTLWVDIVGGHCGWTLWVDIVGGHCGWTLWEDIVGGHIKSGYVDVPYDTGFIHGEQHNVS